ncbi:uncharacterized protein LOC125044826 [Penaeus chinensis]|uniref:uncharacterized protein LOC125044826 n=1 Tax=Penaeus chinensis TaxID=139456 RepID=UPI001FB6516E|nr:uncharacterized protein LOC125044826 [Penaeus chinensis]
MLRNGVFSFVQKRISKAITVIGYPSKDEYILSFPVNTEVIVYSKEAGTNKDLWGVEIKGKRGYVPKRYLRETKLFVKKLEYEVPTELGANVPDPQDNKQVEEPKSENLDLQHEVEQQNDEQVADQVAASAEDIEFQRVTKGLSLEDEQKEEIPDEVGGDDNEGSEEVKDRSIDGSTSVEEDQKVVDPEVKSESVESKDERIDSENASLQNELQEQAESETVSDGEPDPLETSSQIGDMPSPTPTPSSPDYEVIDGTTIYFDDPPPAEVPSVIAESSIHLDSSSVVNEEYSSAQTPPIITDTFTVTDVNAFDATEPTVTQSLDSATSDESELESETVVHDLNPEPTESVTQLFTDQSDIILVDSKPDISPTSSSWIAQAATSVTSWFGESGEVQENNDLESRKSEDNDGDAQLPLHDSNEKDSKDEDKSDFMVPKPESIIEEVVTQEPEAEEESTGFFSSWFGSSEDTNEESENPSSESDFMESDRDSQDKSDVKLNVVSEEGSPVESEQTADPTVSSVPSDAENTLVDQYEPPASDVDDTAYKPHAVQDGPPTVESSPDATVVPNPQAFTDDLTSTDDTLTPSDAYDNAEEDSDQSSGMDMLLVGDGPNISVGSTGNVIESSDKLKEKSFEEELDIKATQLLPDSVDETSSISVRANELHDTVDSENSGGIAVSDSGSKRDSSREHEPYGLHMEKESKEDEHVLESSKSLSTATARDALATSEDTQDKESEGQDIPTEGIDNGISSNSLSSNETSRREKRSHKNKTVKNDQSKLEKKIIPSNVASSITENVNVSASDSSSNSAGVTGESVTNTDHNHQPTVDTEAQSVESPLLVSSEVEDSPSRVEDSPSELGEMEQLNVVSRELPNFEVKSVIDNGVHKSAPSDFTEPSVVYSDLLEVNSVSDVDDPPASSDNEQEELGPSTARPLFAEPTPSVDPENLAHLAGEFQAKAFGINLLHLTGLVSNDTDHLICAHFRTDDSFLKLLTNSIIGHNTRKKNVHGAIKLIEKLFTDVGQEDVTPEYFEEKLELLAQRKSVPSKTNLDPNCYDEVPSVPYAKGTNDNDIQNREEDVLTVDLPNSLYKVSVEEEPESFLRQLSLSDQSDIFGESQGLVSTFNSLEKKNEINNVEYQVDRSDAIEMPKIQDQLLLTSSDDKDSNFLSKSLDKEMDLISSKSSVEPVNSILNETITFGNVIEHDSDVIPLESKEVTAEFESHDEISNNMIDEKFDTHIHLVHERDTQSSKVFGEEVLLHQDVIRDVYTLSTGEIVKSNVLNDADASVSEINAVDTITAEGTIEADGSFTVGTVGEEVDIFSAIGLDEMIHEVHTHVAELTDEIDIVSPEFVVEEVDIVSPESIVEEVGIVSFETVVEEIAAVRAEAVVEVDIVSADAIVEVHAVLTESESEVDTLLNEVADEVDTVADGFVYEEIVTAVVEAVKVDKDDTGTTEEVFDDDDETFFAKLESVSAEVLAEINTASPEAGISETATVLPVITVVSAEDNILAEALVDDVIEKVDTVASGTNVEVHIFSADASVGKTNIVSVEPAVREADISKDEVSVEIKIASAKVDTISDKVRVEFDKISPETEVEEVDTVTVEAVVNEANIDPAGTEVEEVNEEIPTSVFDLEMIDTATTEAAVHGIDAVITKAALKVGTDTAKEELAAVSTEIVIEHVDVSKEVAVEQVDAISMEVAVAEDNISTETAVQGAETVTAEAAVEVLTGTVIKSTADTVLGQSAAVKGDSTFDAIAVKTAIERIIVSTDTAGEVVGTVTVETAIEGADAVITEAVTEADTKTTIEGLDTVSTEAVVDVAVEKANAVPVKVEGVITVSDENVVEETDSITAEAAVVEVGILTNKSSVEEVDTVIVETIAEDNTVAAKTAVKLVDVALEENNIFRTEAVIEKVDSATAEVGVDVIEAVTAEIAVEEFDSVRVDVDSISDVVAVEEVNFVSVEAAFEEVDIVIDEAVVKGTVSDDAVVEVLAFSAQAAFEEIDTVSVEATIEDVRVEAAVEGHAVSYETAFEELKLQLIVFHL